MTQTLWAMLIATMLLATYAPPVTAATRNACYVTTLKRGQYVVQTSGEPGTLNVYTNETYATTISRLNQAWYATADKTARVAVYDNGGYRIC